MYQAHFGLQELPFGITPDTSFAYACASHQEALNTLLVAVKNGEGFIKITGEVGTGKTLLCRKFLATLDDTYASAYIPNPYLEPRTLLLALAEELGVNLAKEDDQHHLIKGSHAGAARLRGPGQIGRVMPRRSAGDADRKPRSAAAPDQSRNGKRKLLQVVLFGQPELDDKLAQESVRQLRQRITFQYRLGELGRDELDYYLAHRLRVAGYRGNRLFTKSAVRALHRASGGIPRLVNVMAHKTMLLAYGEGAPQVTPQHVRAATRDTPAARQTRWWWGGAMLAAVGRRHRLDNIQVTKRPMSLINQMLQDLEKRRASGGERGALPNQVRVLPAQGKNRFAVAVGRHGRRGGADRVIRLAAEQQSICPLRRRSPRRCPRRWPRQLRHR